jgi:hypothetical protein
MEAVEPTVSDAVVRRWPKEVFTTLSALGLVIRGPDADRVTCPECHDHVEEVVVLDGPNGDAEYYVPCPQFGRAAVPAGARRQWSVDLRTVTTRLAATFQLTGKTTVLIDDRLWRLGRTLWNAHSSDVLLARGLHWENAAAVRGIIAAARKPIVFVPDARPPDEVWRGRIPTVLALSEVASLTDRGIDFDSTEIAAADQDAEAKATVRENGPQGEKLKSIIRQEVIAHAKFVLTDDVCLAAFRVHQSYRKAATHLSEKLERPVSKDRIKVAVDKAGGIAVVLDAENSDSVFRTVASQSRDTRGNTLIHAKPKRQ